MEELVAKLGPSPSSFSSTDGEEEEATDDGDEHGVQNAHQQRLQAELLRTRINSFLNFCQKVHRPVYTTGEQLRGGIKSCTTDV